MEFYHGRGAIRTAPIRLAEANYGLKPTGQRKTGMRMAVCATYVRTARRCRDWPSREFCSARKMALRIGRENERQTNFCIFILGFGSSFHLPRHFLTRLSLARRLGARERFFVAPEMWPAQRIFICGPTIPAAKIMKENCCWN